MEGEGMGCERGRTAAGSSVRGEGGRDWRCGVNVGSSDEFCRIAGYMTAIYSRDPSLTYIGHIFQDCLSDSFR